MLRYLTYSEKSSSSVPMRRRVNRLARGSQDSVAKLNGQTRRVNRRAQEAGGRTGRFLVRQYWNLVQYYKDRFLTGPGKAG